MYPATILASQKLASLLTNDGALPKQIQALADAAGQTVPVIPVDRVSLSAAAPDLADKNIQLTYPRVCLYSIGLKNSHIEKFKSLSGTVSVVTEVWASGNLVNDTEQWMHYYIEAITMLYRQGAGDLYDGFYFSGAYEVQVQPPKAGGIGFSQSAKIACTLNMSQS
jgi:hypothetical protein